MKTMLRLSMVLALLMVVGHAQVLNSFDAAPADTNYWEWYEPVTEGGSEDNPGGHYAISTNADPELGWIHTSYVNDIVLEGDSAMRIDYSIHNSESWGGYSKLHHYYPDTLSSVTYDFTMYDSLSFSYYNVVPQDSVGRVHLRLNMGDYADIDDPAYHDLGELWYSFHYILDNEPGWHTVNMLLDNTESWDGAGWTYTGWSGAAGDLDFDKDKIKSFAFEFSVNGSGIGDVVTGSIIIDDLKLTGSRNKLTNGGFEMADAQEDGMGWGVAHAGDGAAHARIVEDAEMARSGNFFAELGTENGGAWAVFYTEDSIPAAQGQTWELGGYIKNISETFTEGAFGGYKIEAKNAAGDILATTGDVLFETTTDYEKYTATMVMPEGTAQASAVLVATRWDGSNVNYAYDDLYFMNLGTVDTEAPVAVNNVSAIPGTNYNLVTWEEVPGEEGESYTIYASQFPITDLTSGNVDVVAAGHLEGAPSVVHYLYAPLNDTPVDYYYAVVCTDSYANVGAPGYSASSFTNTALGIPTISLDPPANFVADGFFDEWTGVMPFHIGVSTNSWGVSSIWSAVDDDEDCSATIYMAADDEYLYIAADVLDNVFNGYVGEGNWWDMDAFQLFIGLYNQRGERHNALLRGSEPDYGLIFTNDFVRRDNGDMFHLGEQGDGNYYFEGFNPDYVVEARIPLDSLAYGNGYTDTRYMPTNGDRILIEPILHDNDGNWEGNVQSSPLNQDNAWQTPGVWSYTFVGDTDAVSVDEVARPGTYRLSNNYPNPFNPSTMISYEIGQSEQVRLSVYNVLGQEVMVLVNAVQDAGVHEIQFQAGTLASGVYLYRLEAGSFTTTNKMILMK
jgi:hypothetical protein